MSLPTRRFPRRIALSLALALACGGVATARAQNVTLDEGTFRITIGGRDVGRETFSIRQSGPAASATINARGNVIIDTTGVPEELTSVLQLTGAGLQPTAYNLRATRNQREEQIAGRIVAGRFIAKIVSPTGEELREYLASDRAVLIDRGIVHQYYFLARRMQGESMRVPVIIPRRGQQVTATVQLRGEEEIAVGGQRITARHLVVQTTGGEETHLWVDERARVLRLEIPAARLTASRTSPPRN